MAKEPVQDDIDLIEPSERLIWCCACGQDVPARLTNGAEVYPHRLDLADLPFWRCDSCTNFVGCHHKTRDRIRPLGCIPTPEIKQARQKIHQILDPLWQRGRVSRREVYGRLAQELGIPGYHTADIKSIDEARIVYRAVQQVGRDLRENHP